jgi:hypothetical protein
MVTHDDHAPTIQDHPWSQPLIVWTFYGHETRPDNRRSPQMMSVCSRESCRRIESPTSSMVPADCDSNPRLYQCDVETSLQEGMGGSVLTEDWSRSWSGI